MADRSSFNFDIVVKGIKKALVELPKEIAEVVAEQGVVNIKSGSFYGKTWVPRKIEWTHPPLQLTGELLKAVEKSAKGGKIHQTPNQNDYKKTFIGTVDNPYGSIHNYGAGNMPARPFIEHHPDLDKKVIVMIFKKINPKFDYIVD